MGTTLILFSSINATNYSTANASPKQAIQLVFCLLLDRHETINSKYGNDKLGHDNPMEHTTNQ